MSHNRNSKEIKNSEHVFSPLHRLQADLSREKEFPFAYNRAEQPGILLDQEIGFPKGSRGDENDSIYSFDSVSTSGRLLDRLDLDADDYNDYEEYLRRRGSAALIQSMRRNWEFPSDSLAHGLAHGLYADLKQIPIRANSTAGLDRMRSGKPQAPTRTLSQSNRIPVQSGPGNLTQQKKNQSYDSLHADLGSRQNSTTSLSSSMATTPPNTQPPFPKPEAIRSHQKFPTHSPILESTSEFPSPIRPGSAKFSPVLTRSADSQSLVPFSARRSISSSSIESPTPVEGTAFVLNVTSKFDPTIDAATRKALAIRAQGNHREASYQLQTLANAPYNYPKAMYLYAKALKIGQGVKLNEAHSNKWLCRCILTSYIAENSSPDSQAFTSYMSKLANLLPEILLEMVKINLAGQKYDPFVLMETFQALSQAALNKITQMNSSDKNIVGGAYALLAEALLKGQGMARKDEVTGRLFLEKSASLAYADSMTTLGELWCSKTKQFKKDYHIASAWLRLGELFGKKDIGNSWIYKSKYLEQKKK